MLFLKTCCIMMLFVLMVSFFLAWMILYKLLMKYLHLYVFLIKMPDPKNQLNILFLSILHSKYLLSPWKTLFYIFFNVHILKDSLFNWYLLNLPFRYALGHW